jgi:hypothetical protein
MTNLPPQPDYKNSVARASALGVPLSIFGIIAFAVIYTALGGTGINTIGRILLSLCLPPVFIALILGAYVMLTRRRSS